MVSPNELLSKARGRSLESLIRQGLGGALLGVATMVISGVISAGEVVTKPLDALGVALSDLTMAIFGAPADILIAGADESARSLGAGWSLGPFTFAFAVVAVLAALWIVGRYRDEEETGNIVPGLPFDVPFIGESEEAGDE